mmetsp:Transcript_41628/g.109811  ORF Transcript_41628/g.109811 Transcript_41628/m.109811 type:complete len:202 (-) Transcript_41628:88-693(-)
MARSCPLPSRDLAVGALAALGVIFGIDRVRLEVRSYLGRRHFCCSIRRRFRRHRVRRRVAKVCGEATACVWRSLRWRRIGYAAYLGHAPGGEFGIEDRLIECLRLIARVEHLQRVVILRCDVSMLQLEQSRVRAQIDAAALGGGRRLKVPQSPQMALGQLGLLQLRAKLWCGTWLAQRLVRRVGGLHPPWWHKVYLAPRWL